MERRIPCTMRSALCKIQVVTEVGTVHITLYEETIETRVCRLLNLTFRVFIAWAALHHNFLNLPASRVCRFRNRRPPR